MTLIHPPNTIAWQTGDHVIHDADAKRADMLMVVIGRSRDGIFRTRYLFPDTMPRAWKRKIWRNTLDALHDPSRFGIVVPRAPATTRGTSASTIPPAPSRPAALPSAKS
jgi:hypothetical protein